MRTPTLTAPPPSAPPALPPCWFAEPRMTAALAAHDLASVYRLLLAEYGYSQRVLATQVRQSQSEVSEILAGREVRSYDLLVRIADALHVPRGLMGLAFSDFPDTPAPIPSKRNPVRIMVGCPDCAIVIITGEFTGTTVLRLRRALRLDPAAFATELGATVNLLLRWENGGDAIVPGPAYQDKLRTLLRLADPTTRARFTRSGRRRPNSATTTSQCMAMQNQAVGWSRTGRIVLPLSS